MASQIINAFKSNPSHDELRAMDRDLHFYPSRVEHPTALSAEDVAAFNRDGYLKGIRICDEAESRLHNQQYRGRDKPTNVLSFPAEAVAGENLLGDLLICAPVVQREAAEQRKLPRAHWAHMVIHGTLHLLGMDHQDARAATIMEQRETRLLAAFGFPDPYTSQNTSS